MANQTPDGFVTWLVTSPKRRALLSRIGQALRHYDQETAQAGLNELKRLDLQAERLWGRLGLGNLESPEG